MLDPAQNLVFKVGNLKGSSHKKRLHDSSIPKYLVTFQYVT